MQKELLLAISDDRASSYNLRFLKETFHSISDLKLTLFYVAPRMATWQMHDNGMTRKGESLDQLVAHKEEKGEKAEAGAKKWLQDIAGCEMTNIQSKVIHSKKGTVQEIIEEAREGLYDALLLGRKGFTWFEEMFANSVTHELLWKDIDFPIWVCKQPSSKQCKDILLCMDGSDASVRMADHAGYMLCEEDHTFTLFHVAQDGFSGDHAIRCFDSGLAALTENGVPEERVELKVVSSQNVVRAILEEVERNSYSAVGVGRRGECNQTKIENMFPSSVSVNLMRQLKDTALWVSK